MFEISGVLKVKKETQAISDKFKKREFVLQDDSSSYPQYITFQLVNDKCNSLDGFDKGDQIKVWFFLQGREYTKDGETRYFNSLTAYRIELVSQAEKQPETIDDFPDSKDDDSLPF